MILSLVHFTEVVKSKSYSKEWLGEIIYISNAPAYNNIML